MPNNVQEVRKSKRLTQAELAQLAAVPVQTLSALEQGRKAPSVVLALRVAAALDTTVEALFS